MGGDSYLDGKKILNLRCGEDFSVEEEANRWLARSREGITALSEKRDWLSYDQLQLRRLKKMKLDLKDKIQHIENLLIPDIIA